MQVYTAGQLKKTFSKVQVMSPTNSPEQIYEQARGNQLVISSADAAAVTEMMADVAATYSIIREIDTTGFETVGTFVPIPYRRESD